MKNKNQECLCGCISDLEICEPETMMASDRVTMLNSTEAIRLQDEFLIIRKDKERTQFYLATLNDLGSEAALLLLEKAVQSMPKNDPADGRSLWLNDGFICLASGDASNYGMLAPSAFRQSLTRVLKTLPTTDPRDGSPWLCGGVLMQGSSDDEDECD